MDTYEHTENVKHSHSNNQSDISFTFVPLEQLEHQNIFSVLFLGSDSWWIDTENYIKLDGNMG